MGVFGGSVAENENVGIGSVFPDCYSLIEILDGEIFHTALVVKKFYNMGITVTVSIGFHDSHNFGIFFAHISYDSDISFESGERYFSPSPFQIRFQKTSILSVWELIYYIFFIYFLLFYYYI